MLSHCYQKQKPRTGRGKKERNWASRSGLPMLLSLLATHGGIQSGEPTLQPGQPLSPVGGMGEHVKDPPVYFTQF